MKPFGCDVANSSHLQRASVQSACEESVPSVAAGAEPEVISSVPLNSLTVNGYTRVRKRRRLSPSLHVNNDHLRRTTERRESAFMRIVHKPSVNMPTAQAFRLLPVVSGDGVWKPGKRAKPICRYTECVSTSDAVVTTDRIRSERRQREAVVRKRGGGGGGGGKGSYTPTNLLSLYIYIR